MARVLLIEDDVQQVLVTSFALRHAGHRVHVAADGERGLHAAQALKPDIIVCDVVMPGMSGFEVVAALRQKSDLVFTPVVMLTAMSAMEHMRRSMTSGADDFLTKPCTPQDLCRAVDAALARRARQSETVAGVISEALGAALEKERQALALRYEVQLTREVSARWEQASEGDLHFGHAFVAYTRLYGMRQSAAEPALSAAERLKTAYRAARDTLYLFGAQHVVPHADAFVGIFSSRDGDAAANTALRVVNAAFALARQLASERHVAIGLHRGDVDMVSVSDPLHGETGHALLTGDTLAIASSVAETAERRGWQVAASGRLAALLPGDVVQHASSSTGSAAAVGLLPGSHAGAARAW